jgi:hypothetical protein
MTAGSGILHQEMPKGDAGANAWLSALGEPALVPKMTAPRYQDIPSSAIPGVTDDEGTRVRIVCGEFWGKKGPVEGFGRGPKLPRCPGTSSLSTRPLPSHLGSDRGPPVIVGKNVLRSFFSELMTDTHEHANPKRPTGPIEPVRNALTRWSQPDANIKSRAMDL